MKESSVCFQRQLQLSALSGQCFFLSALPGPALVPSHKARDYARSYSKGVGPLADACVMRAMLVRCTVREVVD